ncbi:hypothetical protein [Streptomyces sp. NPDC017993]
MTAATPLLTTRRLHVDLLRVGASMCPAGPVGTTRTAGMASVAS